MPKFPFTNYHELNLDWILKKVEALFTASEENARTIRTYDTRLTRAEQTATSAATAATSAQQLADAAAANADNALSVAGTANTKADSALTAATTAAGAASGALTTAQEARQIAGNAQSAAADAGAIANDASNAAAAAQQTAYTNAGNIATLQTKVDTISGKVSDIDNKADVIISSASGSIASFADGADDMPIRSLVTNIDPVQEGSGDPSPTNIRPITGHTGAEIEQRGKNLLLNVYSAGSSITVNGITYTNDNGVIKVTGTPTGNAYYELFRNVDGQRLPLKAGTYTISCAETTSNCKVNFTVVGGVSSVLNENQHSYTFTLSSDAEMYINVLTTGSSAVNLSLHVQLESGSSATAYEPYTGNKISITFPSSAGTVYGGTLDVVSGILTVNKKMITYNGTENWRVITGTQQRYYINKPNDCDTSSSITGYTLSHFGDLWSAGNTGTWGVFVVGGTTFKVLDSGAHFADLAAFKTWLTDQDTNGTPLQIVYPLNSNITYQLTPQQINTLLGSNNIYSDVGSIANVKYPADTKLYIDGKIAELQALVLEN